MLKGYNRFNQRSTEELNKSVLRAQKMREMKKKQKIKANQNR